MCAVCLSVYHTVHLTVSTPPPAAAAQLRVQFAQPPKEDSVEHVISRERHGDRLEKSGEYNEQTSQGDIYIFMPVVHFELQPLFLLSWLYQVVMCINYV